MCVHQTGMPCDWCFYCRGQGLDLQFVPQLILRPEENAAGLVLSESLPRGYVMAMVVDNHVEPRFHRMLAAKAGKDIAQLLPPDDQRELCAILRKIATVAAHVFEPTGYLERRELSEHGPPHCWHCRETLGYDLRSLGCQLCRYYVCSRGFCLCDWPGGRNYLGDYFPPGPGYPFDREARQGFLKVVRHVSPNGNLG